MAQSQRNALYGASVEADQEPFVPGVSIKAKWSCIVIYEQIKARDYSHQQMHEHINRFFSG